MTKLRGIVEKRKNVIHAAGLYLFRLSSASDWTFHYHLCPELIGDVIVTGTSTGKIAGLWYRISHFFSMTYTPIVYRLNPDKLEKDRAQSAMIALANANGAGLTK